MTSLRIEKVMNAVYWVQIDELDLRILCGTPADIVKVLIKKKYIRSVFKDGHHFQTGPNAILLNDTPFQNNKGCNFTEFPILHMLFFQGMFIPNHPNFRKKPLFIGSPEIIDQQLNYLFYGSYGETNREKLVELCESEEVADEIIGMKLKFAYGNFVPYDDIMDIVPVAGHETTEVKEGLSIVRQEKNIFEFEYKGEKKTVNLNLSEGEKYSTTVNPEKKSLPPGKFLVINSGSGDGWDINRTCFSSLLRYDNRYYCVDFGPSADKALEALSLGPNDITAIFQTHVHDDHLNGYEYFWFSGKKLKVYSTNHILHSLRVKLKFMFGVDDREFDERIETVSIPIEEWTDVNGLEVKPFHSAHPVETVNFLFRNAEGEDKKTYAHIGDISSQEVLKNRLTKLAGEDFGISEKFRQKIIENYSVKVEFKKIDIGGGLIHGDAFDFKNDKSDLISLGHISRSLTKEEMEIGILEPFGNSQVLIL